jgi:GT2 family glycosyltransferase
MRFPTASSFALGQNLAARLNLHAPNNSAWQLSDGIRWRGCDVVFTSPLLIRRQAWEQSGGFDATEFPFSDTDLDWAWRCARLGWKMAVIASDNVVHDNLEQLSAWSANRALDFHRNRFRLLKRHRGKRVGLLKPFLFLRHWLETMILARKSASDPTAKEKLARRKQLLRTVWSNYS